MVEASAEIPLQAGFDPAVHVGLLGEPKKINHPARLETTRSGIFSLSTTLGAVLERSPSVYLSMLCLQAGSHGLCKGISIETRGATGFSRPDPKMYWCPWW